MIQMDQDTGAEVLYRQYPARKVMDSSNPPGSRTDIIARVLGEKPAREPLGEPVVIDNGGIIGTELAAKAAPDGHTLLLVPTSHVINPGV